MDGRIHANSGIRMDADQNALASSAVATYTCGAGHGCRTSGEPKPGIWGSGAGGPRGLWRFPSTSVPFAAITADLVITGGTSPTIDQITLILVVGRR